MTFWVAGAAVAGGVIGAMGSNSAADTQAASADRATQAQRDMFERQVQLQEPWRQAGIAGLGKLNTLLGLTPAPAQAAAAAPSTGPPVFGGLGGAAGTPGGVDPVTQAYRDQLGRDPTPEALAYYQQGMARGIPLAAIQQEISTHPEFGVAPVAAAAAQAAAPTDPAYGSLLKPFGMADFQADPGYAFRKSEQEKALQRARSVSGSLGSGAYIKDALQRSGDLASQEFGNANARFNANRGFTLNALQSMAGVGQSATNQAGAAAGQFGQQIGSNIIGAGNAAAAGQVGTANALTGGIGQGMSMYQQNEMLKRFPYYGGTPYNPGAIPSGGGSVGDFPIAYYG